MSSKAQINKQVEKMEQVANHFLKLASELKIMTDVSTPVLKRKTSVVKMETIARLESKYKNK